MWSNLNGKVPIRNNVTPGKVVPLPFIVKVLSTSVLSLKIRTKLGGALELPLASCWPDGPGRFFYSAEFLGLNDANRRSMSCFFFSLSREKQCTTLCPTEFALYLLIRVLWTLLLSVPCLPVSVTFHKFLATSLSFLFFPIFGSML